MANYRAYFEAAYDITDIQSKLEDVRARERCLTDHGSQEFLDLVEEKGKLIKRAKELGGTMQRTEILVDTINMADCTTAIYALRDDISRLDAEILNTNDPTEREEHMVANMRKVLEQLNVKDAELKVKAIEDFKARAIAQRQSGSRDRAAEMMDAVLITDDLPAKWTHTIRGWNDNVIPVPAPPRNGKPFHYLMSSFFNDRRYIAGLNKRHYHQKGYAIKVRKLSHREFEISIQPWTPGERPSTRDRGKRHENP